MRDQGVLDDTLIVLLSDNGASEEGGNDGRSELLWYDDIGARGSSADYADELGGPKHHNHYPRGWAMVGNTPARRFKRNVYGGGVRDPLIIRWPSSVGTTPGIRRQYHHVVDIVPTVLEVIGLELPDVVSGHPQMPMDGQSLLYSATDADAPTRKRVQIYEMWGNRAIWCNGWKAVAEHERGTDFTSDVWELFHTDADFSESRDLAAEYPELLASLQGMWEAEARRLNALPLDDRIHGRRLSRLFIRRAELPETMEYGPRAQVPALLGPGVPTLPHAVEVDCADLDSSASGVLCSLGGRFGGWSLFLHEARLHFDYVYYSYESKRVASQPLQLIGAHTLGFSFEPAAGDELSGVLGITVDGKVVASEVIDVVPLIHSSLEPFEVGQDTLAAVSDLYESPNALCGGRIIKVRAGTRSAIRTDWEPQAQALVNAQ